MNDDLKTLVAIREILGSALRELEMLSNSTKSTFELRESEYHIGQAHGFVDAAIRKVKR